MKKKLIAFVLWYIRFFARVKLQEINPIIIGVAGSSGKSSLVRLIESVLSDAYKVNTTREKNSETGIPLHILNIHFDFSYTSWLKTLILAPLRIIFYHPHYDVLVAEMGIDSPVEPKNMSYLLKIVHPTIGVVTNVTEEHSVYFDPYVKKEDEKFRKEKILQMTADQETLLLKSLPENGTAIINRDDKYIFRCQNKIKANKISFSTIQNTATLFAKNISITPVKFEAVIVYKNVEYTLKIHQALPYHFTYEFLAAISVGLSMHLTITEAIAHLENHFTLPPGRMTLFKGIKNTLLIDSSYNNATLPPLLDMLQFLKIIAPLRRKVAIIGDMRELGSQSRQMHEEFANEVTKYAQIIILIGPLMRNYAVPILKQKKSQYFSFDTFSQAKSTILKEIKEKDAILVKSSQNTLFLERVVEMLLENEEDSKKLCRRGEFWDKKRAQTP